jgi:long-subunit fatty acid transport protein
MIHTNMKKKGFYIGIGLLCGGMLFAQEEMGAYRFSGPDLNGSARSMSMGGAFGALGGDMSAMSHNPAGLGVYRSSEVQATLDLNTARSNATWTGIRNKDSQTRFGFTGLSYVSYFPTGSESGIKGWNLGIAYSKVKNFNRRISATGNPGASMGNYIAARTTHEGLALGDLSMSDSYNPYLNKDLGRHWLPVMGYLAGYIVPKADTRDNKIYNSAFSGAPQRSYLSMTEKGSIDEYNFSMATNISDRVFLGATVAVTDLSYRAGSDYNEEFQGEDRAGLKNSLESEGTGYSVNLGVIVRPTNALRLGVAYNSPKWYSMTDYFFAKGETHVSSYTPPKLESQTPIGEYAEYRLITPGRWIFSAAGIIGSHALLSVDYEISDYSSMYLSDREGFAYEADNKYIREDFDVQHTLKLGGEVKITPQAAVRAGYVFQTGPMKSRLKNGETEVIPIGTFTQYTVANSTSYYTVGLGYRFTPNFYMDIAYIHRIQNEELYPFSNVFSESSEHNVKVEPAKLSVNTGRTALTFGYKF